MLTGSSFADDIRYLSLHDNSYLRYFKGHKKKCVLALLPLQMTDGADVGPGSETQGRFARHVAARRYVPFGRAR